jgi:hypothetical protein
MSTPQAGPGSSTDRRAATTRRRRAVGALALLPLAAVLLAGCSPAPSGGDTSSAVGDGFASDAGGSGGSEGSDGWDGSGGSLAAEPGASEEQAAVDGAVADPASAGRQVVTSGEVSLVAEDPRAAADAVVALVEQAGGRVDARQETAAREDEGVEAAADLTVRVPADRLTGVLDALEDVGEVQGIDLRSEDVTATAQDLDARIRATRVSVARIEDLLSRATTQADIISAENTLTERQSALEQLESQRARVAEQVALSTLRVSVRATVPPVETEPAPRTGFLGGLESGWEALAAVAGAVVLVIGVLLPWAVLGAVVAAGVLLARRALRRRRAAAAPGGLGGTGAPGTSGGGPGGEPHGPEDAGPDPAAPAPDDREPVGAGSPRG